MPVTPYDTGKVKIGVHYTPPQQNYMTRESEHWQNVFLGEHARERRASLRFMFWVACLCVAAFVFFAFRGVITI